MPATDVLMIRNFPCETCTKMTSTACPSCNASFCSLDCGDSMEMHADDCGVQISREGIHIRDTFAQIMAKLFSSLARIKVAKLQFTAMTTTKPVKDCEKAYHDYADALNTTVKKINRVVYQELKASSVVAFADFEKTFIGGGGTALAQIEMLAYNRNFQETDLTVLGNTIWETFGAARAIDWKEAVDKLKSTENVREIEDAGRDAGRQLDLKVSSMRDVRRTEKKAARK